MGCDDSTFHNSLFDRRFQSTHPRGVRRGTERDARGGHDPVSIHAPAWGATHQLSKRDAQLFLFQSTHPRGVRRAAKMRVVGTALMFQSTHPRGVRRCAKPLPSSVSRFQSTHPRGVRPTHVLSNVTQERVSIHAPAWGATSTDDDHAGMLSWVSIHAPAWGATYLGIPTGIPDLVSIHAPAWGATRDIRISRATSDSFNPRTRVGCDALGLAGSAASNAFQSTHPRGVRHKLSWRASVR